MGSLEQLKRVLRSIDQAKGDVEVSFGLVLTGPGRHFRSSDLEADPQ